MKEPQVTISLKEYRELKEKANQIECFANYSYSTHSIQSDSRFDDDVRFYRIRTNDMIIKELNDQNYILINKVRELKSNIYNIIKTLILVCIIIVILIVYTKTYG